MHTSRFERFLPWTGVLAGLLFVVMSALDWGAPSADSSGYVAWVSNHSVRAGLTGAAAGFFCAALLLFVTAVRAALRSGEPRESTYSSAAFAGGIVVAVAVALMGWVQLALSEAAGKHADAAVSTLGYLADFGWVPWLAGSAVLFLAAGLGGLRTTALPRPLAVVTVALGVLSLLGPTGIAVYLLTPVWLVVTGVVLARRGAPAPAVPSQQRDGAPVAV